MNEFEERLKRRLNERVDAQLGAPRPAPVFEPQAAPPTAGGSRQRARWLFPLLTAACVAMVVGGSLTADQLTSQSEPAPPATSGNGTATGPPVAPTRAGPSAAAATSMPTSTAAPSRTASHGSATSSPTPGQATGRTGDHSASSTAGQRTAGQPPVGPTGGSTPSAPEVSGSAGGTRTGLAVANTVQLGGATLRLPAGWVARDYAQYETKGQTTLAAHQWCLTPASTPAGADPGACPLTFATVDPAGNPLDVDIAGGFSSNPSYCSGEKSTTHEQSDERALGGRQAAWRQWQISCADADFDIEQYVVATVPAFVLFSDHVSADVHAAMTQLAAGSQLPAGTADLPLMDRGHVRSVDTSPTASSAAVGVTITLDRDVRWYDGTFVDSTKTFTYAIPAAVLHAALGDGGKLAAGDQLTLHTDGTTVTSVAVEKDPAAGS